MEDRIKSIYIRGLYGVRDYLVKFKDNKLILIGENGSGKTTIARIIYATLSCNWDLLRTYQFTSIQINFTNVNVEVSSSMINKVFSTPDLERFEYFFDNRHRNNEGIISRILETKEQFESSENNRKQIYSKRIQGLVPVEYFSRIIENKNITALYNATKTIRTIFKYKILYLPTYRRIEEPLRNKFSQIWKEKHWKREEDEV